MKISELREMNIDELKGKLEELTGQLFSLRSQSVTEKLENTSLTGNVKKDIAKVKTLIREKQLKG